MMFRRVKKKDPCFKRSKLNVDNVGLLKNRFTYRGLMDDYLKMDAGELKMCEEIRFQGKIQNDFFQGWGELFMLDGILLKGEWKNGNLNKGHMYFEEIDEIKSVYIDIESKNYIINFKNRNEELEDGREFEFVENDKKYKMKFTISKFKGLQLEILVEIGKKTLSKSKYLIRYKINSNLMFKKEIFIENSILSFEIFANYKFIYTLEEIQNGIIHIDKIIVYSNGIVFGGNTRLNAIEKSDLSKKRMTKIMKMPGYYIDFDEFFKNKEKFDFYSKFSLANIKLMKKVKPDSKKHKSEFNNFLKNFMEDTVKNKKVNYFKYLFDNLFIEKEIKIEWKSFDINYFDRLSKFVGKKFNYKERLSRGFLEKRKPKPFEWNNDFLKRFKL